MNITIDTVCDKRVMLRIDLDGVSRFGLKMNESLHTIRLLLQQGCGVCIVPSIGPAFLPEPVSSKKFLETLSESLGQKVIWVLDWPTVVIEKGSLYLSENVFCFREELEVDAAYIEDIKQAFDVAVFDSLNLFDANYATTQGIVRADLPYAFGCHLHRLTTLKESLWRSRIGLIAGGTNAASQLRFISHMVDRLEFVAVGGELGLLLMGRGDTIYGHIKSLLGKTVSLLRKHKVKVLYPVDVVAYSQEAQKNQMCVYQNLEDSEEVCDLGSQSIARILSHVDQSSADMIVFSGCLGSHLDPRYSRASDQIIKELVKRDVPKVLIGYEAILTALRLSVLGAYDFVTEGQAIKIRYLVESRTLDDFMRRFQVGFEGMPESVVD